MSGIVAIQTILRRKAFCGFFDHKWLILHFDLSFCIFIFDL